MMKKLSTLVAVTLIVGSAMLIPTQNAEAWWGRMMPWNWMDNGGWGGYPYYNNYYPYYGNYPYWGGIPMVDILVRPVSYQIQ